MQSALCVDDFGISVFACRYTGALVWADVAVLVGATLPGVKARYVIANTPEAKAAHKAAGIAFHESEESCNTCAYFERVPHEKIKGGFVLGKCSAGLARGIMQIHPDDPMHMECYQSRWGKQP